MYSDSFFVMMDMKEDGVLGRFQTDIKGSYLRSSSEEVNRVLWNMGRDKVIGPE